jgi:hypothetical protein
MDSNGLRRYKFRNKKTRQLNDWSHTKKRGWGNTEGRLTLESSTKQEERKTKE